MSKTTTNECTLLNYVKITSTPHHNMCNDTHFVWLTCAFVRPYNNEHFFPEGFDFSLVLRFFIHFLLHLAFSHPFAYTGNTQSEAPPQKYYLNRY